MSLMDDLNSFPVISTIIGLFDTDETATPLDFELADTTDSDLLQAGDMVTIETAYYGVQTGRVARIVDNPFHGMSGLVAYVIPLDESQGWSEYLTLTGEVI